MEATKEIINMMSVEKDRLDLIMYKHKNSDDEFFYGACKIACIDVKLLDEKGITKTDIMKLTSLKLHRENWDDLSLKFDYPLAFAVKKYEKLWSYNFPLGKYQLKHFNYKQKSSCKTSIDLSQIVRDFNLISYEDDFIHNFIKNICSQIRDESNKIIYMINEITLLIETLNEMLMELTSAPKFCPVYDSHIKYVNDYVFIPFYKNVEKKQIELNDYVYTISLACKEKALIHRVLNKLKDIENKHISSFKKSLGDCPICLEKNSIEKSVKLTTCSHIYHKECINHWSKKGKEPCCPMCRTPMVKDGCQDIEIPKIKYDDKIYGVDFFLTMLNLKKL